MSDMAEVLGWKSPAVGACLARGLGTFGVPDPMTLDQWASEHFYLSKESSYVEQAWEAWPFQRAIMACISNDDIFEIDFMKSARVGYTKMLLAAIGYFIEHKRRNQALWQPTDGDSDEFVKTELEPMLRDVKVMRKAFPAHMSRHKDNTLQQKKFLGCMLHTRGGKAARSYRRISVDNSLLDELDAFDRDVEKEGDPVTLAAKRVEGATFPKLVVGSTPGLKGFSLIDERSLAADLRVRYAIPCPDCGAFHALCWGGKDEATGFKWLKDDPDSVRHVCPHCHSMIDQGQYLTAAPRGRWQNEDASVTIDHAGIFRNTAGAVIEPPRHIAFHVWTAYSPLVTWAKLVREFIAAFNKAREGDITSLKAFTNTTKGETWEQDVEKTDADQLKERADDRPLGHGSARLRAAAGRRRHAGQPGRGGGVGLRARLPDLAHRLPHLLREPERGRDLGRRRRVPVRDRVPARGRPEAEDLRHCHRLRRPPLTRGLQLRPGARRQACVRGQGAVGPREAHQGRRHEGRHRLARPGQEARRHPVAGRHQPGEGPDLRPHADHQARPGLHQLHEGGER
jgi:hypothetical protein